MNKQNLTKEELDRLGRALLETTRMSSAEIERIVSAPGLFDSVKARVAAERARRRARRFWGEWADLSIPNWQKAIAAVAVLTFFLTVVASLFVLKNGEPPISRAIEQTDSAQVDLHAAPVEINPPSKAAQTSSNAYKKQISTVRNPKTIKRFVSRASAAKSPKSARNPDLAKRQNNSDVTREKFYPVTFAGNLEEAGEELHVYRVELPAASLFALGINLPVENENARIKTDLLIGADGVTRAVRLVK